MRAIGRERGQRFQLHDESARIDDTPERLDDRDVVDVGWHQGQHACRRPVADRDRLHATPGDHDRLQERALEGQELRTVGRRAFRKHRDDVAGRERFLGLPIHPMRIEAPRTLDEKGPHVTDQAPGDRPARELRLGNEAHRLRGVQHEDVEPRNVVGDDQHVGIVAGKASAQPRLDVQDAQKARAPAAGDGTPRGWRQEGKRESGRRDAFQHMHTRAKRAVART